LAFASSSKAIGPIFDIPKRVTICRAKFVTCCKSLLAPVVISGSPKTICSVARPPSVPIIRANNAEREIKVWSSAAVNQVKL